MPTRVDIDRCTTIHVTVAEGPSSTTSVVAALQVVNAGMTIEQIAVERNVRKRESALQINGWRAFAVFQSN
jgi:hypothetical protein